MRGIEILDRAVRQPPLELQVEGHVVDAGAEVADLLDRHADVVRQLLGRALHANGRGRRCGSRGIARDSAAQFIAIGLTYCSISASGQSSSMSRAMSISTGRGAQAAHDAADAERVGDRLAQPVLLRHLEVDHGAGLVAGDLDHQHDVVGVLERAAAVGGGA